MREILRRDSGAVDRIFIVPWVEVIVVAAAAVVTIPCSNWLDLVLFP